MRKKLLIIIAMMTMLLVGATLAANAGTPRLILWDGTQEYNVLDKNTGSFGAGHGSYSYDPSTKTLTFNNVNLDYTNDFGEDTHSRFITVKDLGELTINLVGDNTIIQEVVPGGMSSGDFLNAYGDFTKLTITGTGKLISSCYENFDLGSDVDDTADIYVIDANLECHYQCASAFFANNVIFEGKCNVSAYGGNIGIASNNETRFNLSKGGKVYIKDTEWIPITAMGGIKLGTNNKITLPKDAQIIYGGEEYCYGYVITDANENVVNEITIEYSEDTAATAGVNTADHTPMIIFALMTVLVILGTTVTIMSKQK